MQINTRRIGITIAVIAALALILLTVWLWFTHRAFPQTGGTITVKGLAAPVQIYRDEYGGQPISATTQEDLFFAEGYTHAQERFWQMEFQRRVGSARLSEILGKS